MKQRCNLLINQVFFQKNSKRNSFYFRKAKRNQSPAPRQTRWSVASAYSCGNRHVRRFPGGAHRRHEHYARYAEHLRRTSRLGRTRPAHALARLSASESSHHGLSSAVFITNIAENLIFGTHSSCCSIILTACQCEKDSHLRAFGDGLLLTRLDRREFAVDKHLDKPPKPIVLIEEMTAKARGPGGEGLECLTHCRQAGRV